MLRRIVRSLWRRGIGSCVSQLKRESEPALLSDIGKLLTLLWALVFEPEHILKMMNHLMNEHG